QETELRGEVSESAILADQQRKARQLRGQGAQDQNAPAAAQDTAPDAAGQARLPSAAVLQRQCPSDRFSFQAGPRTSSPLLARRGCAILTEP
ncbi:MAG: hypothetical protein EOS37_26845, partial [Mesorhizobium sp.]